MPRAQRLADRLWTAMACLWLAIFPLWQDGSFSRITRAKWQGMLLLTGLCLLLALLTAACALLRRESLPFRFQPSQGIALALFGWMGLSALLAPYHQALNGSGFPAVWMGAVRYEGMATQLCYMAIFLLLSLHPVRMKPVIHTASAALLIFAVITAAQYAGSNPLGLFPAGRSVYTNYEFQGTIGNIDMVSGYLSLTVPLLLGAFVMEKEGGWLWLAAGLSGVLLWCCIQVQSGFAALLMGIGLLLAAMLRSHELRFRGMLVLAGVMGCIALRRMLLLPWLDGGNRLVLTTMDGLSAGLLAGTVICLLGSFALRKYPGRSLSAGKTALTAVVLLAVILAVFLLLPLTPSHGGLWEIRQTLLGRGEDAFGSYRLAVWRHALAIAREHPLLGTGPDTFLYALRDRLAALGTTLPETFDNPHNEYLALLSNCGLPALAAYLTLLAACLRRQAKQCWPLLASAACFALQGMFSFSICLVSPMWWCLLGMETARESPGAN